VTTFLEIVTWLALALAALVVGVFLLARRR
jgi:hypothetical protein